VVTNNSSDELVKEQDDSFFLDTPHLQNLLHLLEYLIRSTRKIILITGVAQAGKTALSEAFLRHLPQDIGYNCLSGRDFADADTVIQSICQRFELPQSEPMAARELVLSLDAAAKHSDTPPPRQLLVIDDAQALDESALEFVVQLALCSAEEDLGFRLVLFARPELQERLSGLSVPANRVYQHALSNFKITECRQLLQRYIGEEPPGDDGENVLTDSFLGKIYGTSQGLPGKLLEEYRASMATGRARVVASPLKQGAWQAVAAVFLVAVFLVIYLTSSVDEPVPASAKSDDIVQAQKAGSGRIDRRALEAFKAVDIKPAADIPTLRDEVADLDTASTRVITEPTLPKPETNIVKEILPEVSSVPSAIEVPELVEMEKPVMPAKERSEQQPESLVKETLYSEDEQLILALAPTEYTIQLMGSRTHDRIEKLMVEVAAEDQFMLFETIHKKEPWVVLLYGHFKDRQGALVAESKLHPDLRKLNPWIRRVADIQQTLKNRPVN